jgi:hypothetical protein
MKWAPFRAPLALVQLVLLLAMQLAEGTGVHRCPEHDAGVGAGSAQEHAMHDMMGHERHPQPHGEKAHTCRCIGTCPAATVMYRGPEVPVLRVALVRYQQPQTAGVVSLCDTVRLLPFAIGPPASA